MSLFWTMMLSLAAAMPAPDPADERPALTREQARTLSPQEVAGITFRELAEQVREVGRPTSQGVPYPDERLKFLNFAFAPEATQPGLCRATVMTVSYASDAPETTNGERLPVHPQYVSTHSAYRVAGNLEWTGPWQAEDRRRQLALCREAGRVIAADVGDVSQSAYFTSDGPLAPVQAAGILQRALAEVRAGTLPDLQCAAEQVAFDPCTDPRAVLQPVTLDDLAGVQTEAVGPSLYRVNAEFRDPAHRDRQFQLSVRVDVEMDASRRIVRIGAVRVSRFLRIFD